MVAGFCGLASRSRRARALVLLVDASDFGALLFELPPLYESYPTIGCRRQSSNTNKGAPKIGSCGAHCSVWCERETILPRGSTWGVGATKLPPSQRHQFNSVLLVRWRLSFPSLHLSIILLFPFCCSKTRRPLHLPS